MTWQHLLRTLAIAFLGAAALILAAEARAEGGDAGTVISPDRAEEFLKAAAAEAKAMAEEEASDTADVARTQAEEAGNQTASLPSTPASTPADARLRLRSSDAMRGHALKPLIARYASENGLPYELADAVVRLESRYNAGARNGPNMGLTQINVRTAQALGYQGPAAGLLDAETNLRYGLKYLAKAYRLAGGDTCGTILRYQFGHRTQAMTGASRAYCARVKVITAAAE